ncbi:ATP-binding protein [Cryptosporangium sp. NPDC048952]|uniref:ATP-binding protein n=1 Tax=Cryptosporangium sp. NPDC048952 TaxID=3363961 RepID=UPI003711CC2B
MTDLTTSARLESSVLHAQLLSGAKQVGGIYHLDFQDALVSTDDRWKVDAGGIPQHAFLLATVMPLDSAADPEDEEVLLLRVDDTCQLPRQAELVEVREFTMRQMLTDGNLTVDVLTQQEMQRSGLKCKILGTFYQRDLHDGRSLLEFGADVDNIYSASRYRVYKPTPASLATIVSYPAITEDELRTGDRPHLLQIGAVRYSSTRRRARNQREDTVPVHVRVDDFIEMKSAVFGMTRMGKSNTMKTLAVATYRHSKSINVPIGQLLFDPQGEYANPNSQDDDTALAQLGDDVVIYRFGARDGEEGARPLQINFYDQRQITAAQEIIGNVLASVTTGNYIQNFIGADLAEPQPGPDGRVSFSRRNRASRARFCFYALLGKADFSVRPGTRFSTSIKAVLANAFNADQQAAAEEARRNGDDDVAPVVLENVSGGSARVVGIEGVQAVVDWIIDSAENGNAEAEKWLKDQSVEAVLQLYNPTGNQRGWRYLRELRSFHSPYAGNDYAGRIHDDLVEGRIVIVDLSRGTEQVLQLLSERIINHILSRATERFTSGGIAHRMQIVIEEAHRLFDRKAYDSTTPNPYVRLAKEAAKFRIGLIYATQEVTAVAPAVLANTSNWVVAHLNNSDEIRALSKYYDFKSFESAILSSEDRGFVRIKTRSGKYIIPVQVSKFDRNMINAARVEAGFGPLLAPTNGGA